MSAAPASRRRALLPGIAAATWANAFALGMVAGVVVLVVLGLASQPWMPAGGAIRLAAAGAGAAVVVLAVLSGAMVFVRLAAERRQGYTTIDGFRVGAGVSLAPGTPDTVDTVDARTGLVLRDAGDSALDAETLAVRQREARSRSRAGERPILLDPRR